METTNIRVRRVRVRSNPTPPIPNDMLELLRPIYRQFKTELQSILNDDAKARVAPLLEPPQRKIRVLKDLTNEQIEELPPLSRFLYLYKRICKQLGLLKPNIHILSKCSRVRLIESEGEYEAELYVVPANGCFYLYSEDKDMYVGQRTYKMFGNEPFTITDNYDNHEPVYEYTIWDIIALCPTHFPVSSQTYCRFELDNLGRARETGEVEEMEADEN